MAVVIKAGSPQLVPCPCQRHDLGVRQRGLQQFDAIDADRHQTASSNTAAPKGPPLTCSTLDRAKSVAGAICASASGDIRSKSIVLPTQAGSVDA